MILNGRHYTREAYFRHAGSETQAFGVRAMTCRAGEEALVKTFEVDTGGGLTFSVGENKGMDIYRMSYRGINLGFTSKAGLHSPYNVNPESASFRSTQGCGMLYTAGITNVGGPCEDDMGHYCAHGNIKNSVASQVCARGEWNGDEYEMSIAGDLREAEFYGRNLHMRRTISTVAGRRGLTLEDVVENRAFAEDHVMLLYHFNTGFPFLVEGARLIAPIREARGLTRAAGEHLDQLTTMPPPIPNEEEYVYLTSLNRDAEGFAGAAIWNAGLRIGVSIRFDARVLDRFVLWKCPRAGDYAFGMLPANCHPLGRLDAAEHGGWTALKPFEAMKTRLEIDVLDGDEDLRRFEAWVDGCTRQG